MVMILCDCGCCSVCSTQIHAHTSTQNTHTDTTETGKQGCLYGDGLGKPHQNPSSTESLGCSLHYTLDTENTSVQMALPTTVAAKERGGKPSNGQQPKIDTIYKNQQHIWVYSIKTLVIHNVDVYQKAICGHSSP